MPVHEKAIGASVEWYTPALLFERLGNPTFDLDPACAHSPLCAVPVRATTVRGQDGLSWIWHGHVWLNPPYGKAGVTFVERMMEHRDGLLLLPSRTETVIYQRAIKSADLVCLLRDRLWFTRSDGYNGRSSFGSTLFAFGDWAVKILREADLGWMTGKGLTA